MFGYPSRYVEGYVVLNSQLGEPEDDSTYEVSVKDKCAHAWAEVFIDNAGWYPAEFTPGYDNDNPNLTQQEKDPKEVTTTKTQKASLRLPHKMAVRVAQLQWLLKSLQTVQKLQQQRKQILQATDMVPE